MDWSEIYDDVYDQYGLMKTHPLAQSVNANLVGIDSHDKWESSLKELANNFLNLAQIQSKHEYQLIMKLINNLDLENQMSKELYSEFLKYLDINSNHYNPSIVFTILYQLNDTDLTKFMDYNSLLVYIHDKSEPLWQQSVEKKLKQDFPIELERILIEKVSNANPDLYYSELTLNAIEEALYNVLIVNNMSNATQDSFKQLISSIMNYMKNEKFSFIETNDQKIESLLKNSKWFSEKNKEKKYTLSKALGSLFSGKAGDPMEFYTMLQIGGTKQGDTMKTVKGAGTFYGKTDTESIILYEGDIIINTNVITDILESVADQDIKKTLENYTDEFNKAIYNNLKDKMNSYFRLQQSVKGVDLFNTKGAIHAAKEGNLSSRLPYLIYTWVASGNSADDEIIKRICFGILNNSEGFVADNLSTESIQEAISYLCESFMFDMAFTEDKSNILNKASNNLMKDEQRISVYNIGGMFITSSDILLGIYAYLNNLNIKLKSSEVALSSYSRGKLKASTLLNESRQKYPNDSNARWKYVKDQLMTSSKGAKIALRISTTKFNNLLNNSNMILREAINIARKQTI